MADIIVSKKNESYIQIHCDLGTLHELAEHFTFFIDGHKHMPKFKLGIWDGKLRLLNLRDGTLPAGLYDELKKHAEADLGYTVEVKDSRYGLPGDKENISIDEVVSFVKTLNLRSNGQPIEVRDYQIQSIYNCIRNQKQISISPTGSGKSLILYCIFRWFLAKNKNHIMLIVPNLGLIRQMHSDFKDYSSHDSYDIDSNTQIIAEGASKEIKKQLLIGTWQSIYKQPSKWFNDNIDVIMADECLHPDTLITMSDGTKSPIHEIKVGDLIKAFDEHNKIFVDEKVINIHKNMSVNEKMFEIQFDNGKNIKITGNHKVLLASGEWKRADTLRNGDLIKDYICNYEEIDIDLKDF